MRSDFEDIPDNSDQRDFPEPAEREPLDPPRSRDVFTDNPGWGWWWLPILLFSMFLFGSWGWWRKPEPAPWPVTLGPLARPTYEQSLRQRAGEEFSLSGEAVRTLGAHAFVVSNDALPGLKDTLVLTRRPIQSQILSGGQAADAASPAGGNEQPLNVSADGKAHYKVEGIIRIFHKDAIEKELGAKLDDFDFSAYESKPVLVANSVTPVELAR